jgi:hypothetical protein
LKFGWGTFPIIGFAFYPFFALFSAFLEDPPQKKEKCENRLIGGPRDKNWD